MNGVKSGQLANATGTIRILVHFYLRDPALRALVTHDLSKLMDRAPVEGHGESFVFTSRMVDSVDRLHDALQLVLIRDKPTLVLVVSDEFAQLEHQADSSSGNRFKLVGTDLVRAIRARFRFGRHLIGLLGIRPGVVHHVSDVDRMISTDGLTSSLLRQAILNVALGLRMKAEPPARDLDAVSATESLRVEVVQNPESLRRCFALRYQIYGEIMRYLPDEMLACRAKIEMDEFDLRSIHFAAVRERDDSVVGTMRLVLNFPGRKGYRGAFKRWRPDALSVHEDWAVKIALKASAPCSSIVTRLLPEFGVFPILLSTDFRDNQQQVIDEALHGSELSRLVVAPAFRGLGVSRSLVKAAIAKAHELECHSLLLECIPAHVEMYARYGFRRLEDAPHSRPSDLDQFAIGMRLNLQEADVAERARTYLRQIREHRHDFQWLSFGSFDVDPTVVRRVGDFQQDSDSSV